MFWPFKVVKCFVAKTGASSERSRYLIEHIMAAKDKLSTVDFLLWQLLCFMHTVYAVSQGILD